MKHLPRPEALKAAAEEVNVKEAAYAFAKAQYERPRKLFEKGVETEEKFQIRQKEFRQSEAALHEAVANRELVMSGSTVDAIKAQSMAVESFRRKLEAARVRQKHYHLRVPMEGIVLNVNFEENDHPHALRRTGTQSG